MARSLLEHPGLRLIYCVMTVRAGRSPWMR
jgi:hypothetical protein